MYDEAIEYNKEAINLNPNYLNSYNNLAIAYAGKGEYSKAIETYQKLIELGDTDPEIYDRIDELKKCMEESGQSTISTENNLFDSIFEIIGGIIFLIILYKIIKRFF